MNPIAPLTGGVERPEAVVQGLENQGDQQGAPARPRESTGWGARPDKQVPAAEARLRQAEQETPPSPAQLLECTTSAEYARTPASDKQQEEQADTGEVHQPAAESEVASERQAQLRAIASDLLYWKGGLKVLKQARLPKWRGSFKWQIEAQIEALQTAHARLRAEDAKPDG
jgi:hypothetical protein